MENNKNIETEVTEEQKSSVTKTLAIFGFMAVIILMVWLAVKIVAVAPSAFTSLASIADSVYNTNNPEKLEVGTKNSVINSGEVFTINWSTLKTPGTYTFSYTCTEGVMLELQDNSGQNIALSCGNTFTTGDTTSLDVIAQSEKNRFTDIHYTMTFTPNDVRKPIVSKDNIFTVVNSSIPTRNDNEVATSTEETGGDMSETDKETIDSIEDINTGFNPTTPEPTYIEEVIYSVPTSDPNGKVDLQITYKAVGIQNGSVFIPKSNIKTDEKGAIQFEVKNIGTKTSENWFFEANLPSGIVYKSDNQVALKPNERALFTLGFEGITKTGTESFGVKVNTKNDTNQNNNSFIWAVEIVK
ncbi:hypothetical protein KC845_01040 [Candidatus Kaiserbacteria bacterium]|nr:hypothetical protein [Candidatus Kaiserbacteria bacterium]